MAASNLEALRRVMEPLDGVDIVRVRREWAQAPEAMRLEALLGLCAPEIEWDVTALNMPGMGVYRGHAGVLEFWRTWLGPWEEYRWYTGNWDEIGDSVILDVDVRVTSRAVNVDVTGMNHTQVYTFRDGRIVRFEGLPRRGSGRARCDRLG